MDRSRDAGGRNGSNMGLDDRRGAEVREPRRPRFKMPERTALIRFEDGDYAGAEVRVILSIPLGDFLALQEAIESGEQLKTSQAFVARVLKDWNLEDEKGVVPPDAEGIKRVEPAFINLLLEKWVAQMVKPPVPLAATSGSMRGLAESSTLQERP